MSTGPEHYLAAEHLISQAVGARSTDEWGTSSRLMVQAQVHATLALAAATAMAAKPTDAVGDGMDQLDFEAWDAVCGVQDEDPYEGMTNADVMSGEELAEYEHDAEARLDAADEERAIAEAKAEREGRYEDGAL